MDNSGFIVPPPGLFSEGDGDDDGPPTPAPESTVRKGAPLPAFKPTPLGVAPPSASTPLGAPAPPALAPTPRRPAPRRRAWRLGLADGQVLEVAGTLVLGRDPAAVSAGPATLVSVRDPAKSVSKSHAVIAPDGSGLIVTDLHSTNGVRVVAPDGATTSLTAGGSTPLQTGSRVRLGEFVVDIRFE